MSFKVVVTGASGFIGRALLAQLKKNNIPVTGLSRQKIEGLISIASYLDCPSFENSVLIHLAQSRDASNLRANREIALCRSLSEKRWQHIVYVSSSIVYGDTRDYSRMPGEKVVAMNEYAHVKLACEAIITSVGGTCLRCANVYGTGMAPHSVIADILRQIPGKGPLIIKDKTPTRDFLWVEDAVNGLMSAALLRPGGILNLGSGVGISIGQVAELALFLAGEHKRPIISTSHTHRLSCIVLDILNTQSLLNWSPQFNMRKGLSYLLEQKECIE